MVIKEKLKNIMNYEKMAKDSYVEDIKDYLPIISLSLSKEYKTIYFMKNPTKININVAYINIFESVAVSS